MEPITRLLERVARAEEESDTAKFFNLLYLGELLCKLTVVGLLAALDEDNDRNRYRLEHDLARSDGLGEWVVCLDEILAGPVSQNLTGTFRDVQRELVERFQIGSSWQAEAARLMHGACLLLEPDYSELPAKVSVRRLFQDFLWLRNKTRGHGAPTATFCSAAAPIIQSALDLYEKNLALFSRSWAYLHRNLSGKYRVIPINGDCAELQHLKSVANLRYANGVYLASTEPLPVPLLLSDVDLSDFWVANGNFRGTSYEVLSYITDDRRRIDATDYLLPPSSLPSSETQGLGSLELRDASFTNVPTPPRGYVERPELETELTGTLHNDRHPVITLTGAGGVGKTSLALYALQGIASTGRYYAILWFSARDIDLLPLGPKLVRPDVLTPEAIAKRFCRLVLSDSEPPGDRQATGAFTRALSSPDDGPYLFVFDNFETVRNPAELYKWLDTYIRLPNKVLITTRLRDFKGDYPVEVGGMRRGEFRKLALQTSESLGVRNLMTDQYLDDLYNETGGHPYVVKVLLGELGMKGKVGSIRRIVASKEDILDALFERTFDFLVPSAQRIFLTLSAWRSLVPRVGLEAVILCSAEERFDVEAGIDLLLKSSMIEVSASPVDGEDFLGVPITAALFGRRKLVASPWKSAIESDLSRLQLFGAMQESDTRHGLGPRIRRFFSSVARLDEDLQEMIPLLELLARKYTPGWLMLGDLLEERGYDPSLTAKAVQRYLELIPADRRAWDRLAVLYRRDRDYLGEVNALVRKSRLASTPFEEISSAAGRLSLLLYDGRLRVDSQEKQVIAEDLLQALEGRIGEADGTDCSRIAWLCLHLHQNEKARRYALEGLKLEPTNVHCLRLARRLNLKVERSSTDARPAVVSDGDSS